MNEAEQESAELQAIVALTNEIVGLRKDVREERHGRRLSIAVMSVVLVVGLVVGGLVLSARAQQDARDAAVTCSTRTVGRSDVRAAIRRAVDVVASYADVPASERADLLDQVTVAMLEELPPPAC